MKNIHNNVALTTINIPFFFETGERTIRHSMSECAPQKNITFGQFNGSKLREAKNR